MAADVTGPGAGVDFMSTAIGLAREAAAMGEVPVGAVAVKDGVIIGRGFNRREIDADPFSHAELLAMREASKHLGVWRLTGVTVYVTLEPCSMCAGAMVQARLTQVVYGAADPKAGAAHLLDGHNHRVAVIKGERADECSAVLKEFFARLRKE